MELANSKRSAKGWKTRKDRKALAGYELALRNRKKEYAKIAKADCLTGRRNRALAVGECVLKLQEELEKLDMEKNLLPGTLHWAINEQRIRDTDGKKGFHYAVAWFVNSDEPMMTEEEIQDEMAKTKAQMEAETQELFEGPAEEDLVPVFAPDQSYREDDNA